MWLTIQEDTYTCIHVYTHAHAHARPLISMLCLWMFTFLTSNTYTFNPPLSVPPIGVFLSVLIFLSVAGNILVCLAIYTERSLRRIGNLFLASLAIADLFVASLVMTFAGVNDLLGKCEYHTQTVELKIRNWSSRATNLCKMLQAVVQKRIFDGANGTTVSWLAEEPAWHAWQRLKRAPRMAWCNAF